MTDLELWHLLRAAGLLAYGLLWLSVAMGVFIRTRSLDDVVHRSWVFELHQTISVMAVLATAAHIVLVTQDRYVTVGLRQVLLPMTSDWRPVPITFGVLGTYMLGLVMGTSMMRHYLSYRSWRAVHFLAFPAWLTALVHGLLSGNDSHVLGVTWIYALSAEAVLLLLIQRFVLTKKRTRAQQVRSETAGLRIPVYRTYDQSFYLPPALRNRQRQ
jgi:predicted ferric reductase